MQICDVPACFNRAVTYTEGDSGQFQFLCEKHADPNTPIHH